MSPKGMVQDQGWKGLWELEALLCPVRSRSPWAGWNNWELSSGQGKHAENIPEFLFLPSHPSVLSSPLQPACENGVLLPAGEVRVIFGEREWSLASSTCKTVLILSAKRLS